MLSIFRLLLWHLAVKLSCHDVVTASLCLGRLDIFASIRENSPMGALIANLSISTDLGANGIRLCLTGENADWFFLEGRSIRLNASSRTLDREAQGSILIAELRCYEDDFIRSRSRLVVEILNENDNTPHFLQETIQPQYISELTSVNSVVFIVKAVDEDGDTISYIIDKSQADSAYFRIDFPNSGSVVLDKPLDYEAQTQLQLVIIAMETHTAEKFHTTATLTVNVNDGDDQYPRFLPCVPVSVGVARPVCTNPIYTANITENHQNQILDFSPGPIHAEDGDRSLNTPLIYTILSGADHGSFLIDSQTGEMTFRRPEQSRGLKPTVTLQIMVSQLNDPMKYSVATALVTVLAQNHFPPFFNRTSYNGFVTQSSSPASIVCTYGSQALLVQATDHDFTHGLNPNLHYSLHPSSDSDRFDITQAGVLIARTDRLQAFDRRILQVVARDEQSGEVAMASVDIEVLQRGQPVPPGPLAEEQLFGEVDTRLAGGISAMILLLFVAALVLLGGISRRRRSRRDPSSPDAVSLGNHPSVMTSNRPSFLMEETSYDNKAFSHNYGSSPSESLHGRQGVYTRKHSFGLPSPGFPSREAESSSRAGSDVMPEIQSGSFRSWHKCDAVMDKVLQSVREERESVQEKLYPVLGRTGSPSTEPGTKLQGDDTWRVNIEMLQSEEALETANPYRTMHAVMCVSDNDSSTEDDQ